MLFLVSLISNKKCPICNSTFPDKVIFCSVCGTELVEEVKKPIYPLDSAIDIPSGHPNSKIFFRDEPLDTKSINEDFMADKTQYAWQISENLTPLRMKGQISYNDSFLSPKLNLKRFKKLSFFEILLLGCFNIIISITLILFSSIVLLSLMDLIPSNWLSIFLILCSTIVYFLFSYFSTFKTAKIISNLEEQSLKMSKSNFFSFSLLNLFHMGLIGIISVICMKLFFPHSDPINSPFSIYVPSIMIIVLIALFSPTFHIAKILSLLRTTGAFENILDAIQFPKIGTKRTLEVIVLSYVIPAFIIMAIFSPTSHILLSFLIPSAEVVVAIWEYIITGVIIVILVVNITLTNFMDVNTFYYYEQSIKNSLVPPSLNWIRNSSDNLNFNNSDIPKVDENYQTNYPLESKEERCPACSATLVIGAEFCTDCGRKIIK